MSQFIEMFDGSAEKVALSSVCDTFMDGDWIEAKDQSNSGIRLIQTGNVGVGTFKDKDDKARYISEETFKHLSCTEVIEGDILISRLPDPVGRACIIPAGLGKSITAVDCTIIRLNDKVLPKFFVAFTNTPDYAIQIKKVLSGTTRLRISRANLGKIQIPIPSIGEQRQFVTIAEQADKSEFDGFKSQFIEMFEFHDLNLNSPSKDFDAMCFDDTSSATKVPAGNYLKDGKFAIYDQAQEKEIAGYSNDETGLCRNYPVVLFGDHSRVVKFINEPFFIGADGVKIIRPKKDSLLPEFLYYDLKYHNIPNTGYNRHFKYIKMISLTKASIEEQRKFLSIARQADKSEFELRKSIDAIDAVIKSLINS